MIDRKKVPGWFDRWMNGERYPGLAREAGVPIGTLRHHFMKHAGGPAAYKEASAEREEAHPRPRTGPTRPDRPDPTLPDDSEVTVLTETPIEEGWNCERRYDGNVREQVFAGRTYHVPEGRPFDVVIAPDLSEYVTADQYDDADLILDYPDCLPWRLRLSGNGRE